MEDVLIVGGGILGCATALHCARRGFAVRVLDRGEPGGGTTPRSFGLVDVLAPAGPVYTPVRAAAVRETAQWLAAEGLAEQVEWNPCGSVNPGVGPEALAACAAAGVPAEWWPPERLAAEEPALHLPGRGALHLPEDACLRPAAYLEAVRGLALRAGVAWVPGEAPALRPVPGGWEAGGHAARRLVVSTGVWSGRLLPGLALAPVRGTILETEALPPLLRRYTPDLRQLRDGRVWIGTSHERAGFAPTVDAAVAQALLSAAVGTLPALTAAPIARTWAGLRPMPADGLPICGAWPGAPGVFVCVAHSGITLAQWLGRRLARRLAGESVPELAPFDPSR